MEKYTKCLAQMLVTLCLICTVTKADAQNAKEVERGKATLAKAFEQKDLQKKQELITRADESFTLAGMKREKYQIIGDAFLDHDDLTQAANYYGRCDKKEKMDGLKRVADAWTDNAFSSEDPKTVTKSLKNAVNYYTKSGSLKDGASGIGDRYFEQGESSYAKALDYYFLATDTASAEKVANAMVAKGGDSEVKAIDIYKQIGSKNAMKKAGDLCFVKNDYEKALDFYTQIGYTDGMSRCAEKFNEVGKTSEAQNVYVKMVESYRATGNTDAIEKLATANVNAGNYQLASKIYDKAGNLALANKYYAYYKFTELDLDSAKILFNQIGEPNLAAALERNIKPLSNLRSAELTLSDFQAQQPHVTYENDPATGKLRPKASDEAILIDYYKGIKDAIVETLHSVSKNTLAITDPTLKQMIMKHFKEYPATNKILDPSFNIKLVKSTAQVKDVYLK